MNLSQECHRNHRDPPLSSQVDPGRGLCWELLWATAPSVLRAEGHGHPDNLMGQGCFTVWYEAFLYEIKF